MDIFSYIIITFAQNIARNIMCNMRYNIKSATEYLAELTGCDVTTSTTAKAEKDKLPLAISGTYGFRDMEMLGTRFTLAIPNATEECSPIQMSKHQAKMMEALGRPVVFLLDSVESYHITRLTRARVNFIVPGKLIFIPSLMMVLHERKNATKEQPAMMTPVAQLLVLYHLQVEKINGMNTARIAEKTDLSYPTINIALKWLVNHGLVELVGRKEKEVHFALESKELWEKALPLMSTPVERVAFADVPIAGSHYSGETAMGHYTMLAEPMVPVVAISKASAKENAAFLHKHYGESRVEIWKYKPSTLSKGDYVDRLSLYLSMKDSDDERVQMECDTIIEEMPW